MNVHLSKENIFANFHLHITFNKLCLVVRIVVSSPYCIEHKQLIIYKLYNKNPNVWFTVCKTFDLRYVA